MNNLIVFDSDFIISNIKTIHNYLSNFIDYDCYVCKISLCEIAKKNSLEKLEIINDFKDNVKQYDALGIKFKNDDEKIMELIENSSEEYLKSIFKNNVILNHNRTSQQLLTRAYNKIPPFGESDKGFKDTLILLDIIDFIKGKNVINTYFITNDRDFLSNKSIIEDEVKNRTKNNFYILDGKNKDKLLNYFNIGNTEEINNLSAEIKEEDNIDVEKFRKNLKDICFDLFHFEGFSPYDAEEFVGDNFIVGGELTKDEIEKFLNDLQKNINKYIFNSNVVISDFFDDPFIFTEEKNIDISIFGKLNNSYNQVKNIKVFKDAFINLIYSNFNELRKSKNDELPF